MKIKKTIAGIILAFSTSGIIASSIDSNAYQKVYAVQNEKEEVINTLLKSEFISGKDQSKLEKQLAFINKIKKNDTRRAINKKIKAEQDLIDSVEVNMAHIEEKVAKEEHEQLLDSVNDLDKYSSQKFIDSSDKQAMLTLKSSVQSISNLDKVNEIRELSVEIPTIKKSMEENHTLIVNIISELKEANQHMGDLSKKTYLSDADKSTISNFQNKQMSFFEDAHDLTELKELQQKSKDTLSSLTEKQVKSELDFKENSDKTKELVQAISNLLNDGNLTADEKYELAKNKETSDGLLQLKNYQPGLLSTNYQSVKSIYDRSAKSSNQRKSEEEQKRNQELEKANAQQKESEQRAIVQQQQASSSPTLVGGWYQAPAGFKFLRTNSGKTYGQVKNPGGYQIITEAQAMNYSPGHGNGSAKQ